MSVDPRLSLALLAAVALGLLGVRLFWRPLRWAVRLVLRVVVGGLVLYAWNAWAPWPHLTVAVNPLTAGTVGALGVPGFLLLLVVRHLV